MTAYPLEMREQAAGLANEGVSKAEIAKALGVSEYTVRRWLDPAGLGPSNAAAARSRQKRKAERRALAVIERQEAIRKAALGVS